jgi:hypothetical protein
MYESSSGKIVESIVITAEETDQFTRRFYNVDEKMQLILLYLRSLGPKFQAKEDPHSQVGPMICITMYYSDGSQRIFRQKGQQYFQEGTGLWQTIDPEKGAALWRIVLHTPSDPEPDPLRHTALPRIDGNWQDPGSIWRIHKQNTRAYRPGAVSSASKA